MEKYKKRIRTFYQQSRRMPSYAEMMELLGFRSKNAVFKLVKRLEEEGFLSKDGAGKLIPNQLYGEVRVLGQVEAGFPSPAEEELCDTMSLDEFLIRNKEATYMLKISGESMKDAGIMPGDMVLVDRSQAPAVGDIVIAEVDGKWTIKYLRKKGGRTYLEPANKRFPLIWPEEELKIAAVVKAVIRKY
jgi:repressor LexA